MPKNRATADRLPGSRRVVAGALCVSLLTLGNGDGLAESGRERDHDRARQALEAGEVLPLRTILERIEREYPGQVIDVELEREHEDGRERWVYKIKLLRSGGALIRLKIDARDASVIGKRRPGENALERERQGSRRGGGD